MALSAMRSPVSGNFSLLELIPTQLDYYSARLSEKLSELVARIIGNTPPPLSAID